MIQQTIENIQTLVERTRSFYKTFEDEIRFDIGLNDCFLSFFKEAEETISRLRNPYITIATVGTTSSGKSTILNGMTGRDIAPSDIDEMSAGILSFTPSDKENRLIVSASPEGYWDSKDMANKTDEEFRNEITRIFGIYKIKKSNRKCSAPEIEIRGKFLWNQYKQIFDVPDEVKFRLIDLPGLRKEEGDTKNLQVIQNVLNEVKPLCLLSMDYSCIAKPEELEVLLKELSDTVRNLRGSTGSIIFLLNKVDLHNDGGASTLEDNIERFRGIVIRRLSAELPKFNFEDIKIIPFVGILFNNAQLSIGLQSHIYSENFRIDKSRLSMLLKNCSNSFMRVGGEISLFYLSCYAEVASNRELSTENAKRLLEICYDISHANELIEEIKKRINNSFYEIVIYPAIYRLKIKFDLLQGYLHNFFCVRKLNNQLAVYSRVFGMLDCQINILGTNKETKNVILKRIEDFRKKVFCVETKTQLRLGDCYRFVEKLNISEEDKKSLLKIIRDDNEKGKLVVEMIVAQSILVDKSAFSRSIYSIGLRDKNLLYSEVKKAFDRLLTNEMELTEISEELSRKYSLLCKYDNLYEKACGDLILGEVRKMYNHTINSNNNAANVLETYSSTCHSHYGDVEKIETAKKEAFNSLKKIEHQGISNLYINSLGIIDRIKGKIQYDLLSPFSKVYPISDYNEEKLKKELTDNGIKKSSVVRLVDMFSIFRKQFNDWNNKEQVDSHYVVYKSSTRPADEQFSSYTKQYKALNNEIRLATSDLMGYNVQLECQDFIENLTKIINDDTESIISRLSKLGFDLDIASIVKLLTIDMQKTPSMPKELFEFADPFKMGEGEIEKRRDNGICCHDYETYYEKEYVVKYPTMDGLYKDWTKGIAGSEKDFWNIFVEWVNQTILEQQDKIQKTITKVSEEILAALNYQHQKLQNNIANQQELLETMDRRFRLCSEVYNLLNIEEYAKK